MEENKAHEGKIVPFEDFFKLYDRVEDLCHEKGDHTKNLRIFKKNLDTRTISLVFLGEVSAGKTTAVNSLIAWDSKENCIMQERLGILPSSQEENTTFIWIIKKSQDNKIRLTMINEGKPETFEKLESLKNRTKELNILQKDSILAIKNPNFNAEIKSIEIELPFFIPYIEIIDFPGISSKNVSNQLINHIETKASCLIYVKDLNSEQAISSNILQFFQDLKKRDSFRSDTNNSSDFENFKLFNMIFTHKDKVFKMENNDVQDNHETNGEIIEREFRESQVKHVLDQLYYNFRQLANLKLQNVFLALRTKDTNPESEIFKRKTKENRLFGKFMQDIENMYREINECVLGFQFLELMERS